MSRKRILAAAALAGSCIALAACGCTDIACGPEYGISVSLTNADGSLPETVDAEFSVDGETLRVACAVEEDPDRWSCAYDDSESSWTDAAELAYYEGADEFARGRISIAANRNFSRMDVRVEADEGLTSTSGEERLNYITRSAGCTSTCRSASVTVTLR